MELSVMPAIGDSTTYEIVGGCLVVRSGTISLRTLKRVLKELGIEQSGYFSRIHSRRLGVPMVIGDSHGLRRLQLLNLEPCETIRNDMQRVMQVGLGADAANWINGYERTVSSDTLFSYLTGVNILHEVEPDLPHCERSLLSCIRMLDLIPELHQKFRKVSVLNQNWRALMSACETLQYAVEEAHPPWRKRHFRMLPRTRQTIAKILDETGLCTAESERPMRTGRLAHIHKVVNSDERLYCVRVDDAKYQWLDKFNNAQDMALGAEIHFRRIETSVPSIGQRKSGIPRIEIDLFANITMP